MKRRRIARVARQKPLTVVSAARDRVRDAGAVSHQPPAFIGFRVAQYGLLFGSALIVTRVLGPTGRAHYALPLALASGISVLIHLTLEGAAGRLLARREAVLSDLVPFLSLALLVLSATGLTVTLAVGYGLRTEMLAGASREVITLAALTIPFVLALQMGGYLLLLLRRLRDYGLIVAGSAAVQLSVVAALALTEELTPETATLATLLGFALSGSSMAFALSRYTGSRALVPRLDRALATTMLSLAARFHPGSIALQFGTRLDLLIVGAMTPAHEAGWYSLAVTLADTALLAAQALAFTALGPQTAAAEDAAVRYTYRFIRRSTRVTFVSALLACAAAYPFIVTVFGPAWRGSVLPTVILICAAVGVTIVSPALTLLARIGRPATLSVAAIAGVILNAGLTVALIPPLGIAGAALASAIAYWMYATTMLRVLTGSTGLPARLAFRAQPALADDDLGGREG